MGRVRISTRTDQLWVESPAELEPTDGPLPFVPLCLAVAAVLQLVAVERPPIPPGQVVLGLLGLAGVAWFIWLHVWPRGAMQLHVRRLDGEIGSEWLVRRYRFTWDELEDVRLDPVPLRGELRELVLVPAGGAAVHTRVRGRAEQLEPVLAAIREQIASARTGATDEGAYDRLRELVSRTRSGASE